MNASHKREKDKENPTDLSPQCIDAFSTKSTYRDTSPARLHQTPTSESPRILCTGSFWAKSEFGEIEHSFLVDGKELLSLIRRIGVLDVFHFHGPLESESTDGAADVGHAFLEFEAQFVGLQSLEPGDQLQDFVPNSVALAREARPGLAGHRSLEMLEIIDHILEDLGHMLRGLAGGATAPCSKLSHIVNTNSVELFSSHGRERRCPTADIALRGCTWVGIHIQRANVLIVMAAGRAHCDIDDVRKVLKEVVEGYLEGSVVVESLELEISMHTCGFQEVFILERSWVESRTLVYFAISSFIVFMNATEYREPVSLFLVSILFVQGQ